MWFYEWFMVLVFGTIGTIVGSVTLSAFIAPISIFAHWYGPKKEVVIKEKTL